jgi:hypothetical protein
MVGPDIRRILAMVFGDGHSVKNLDSTVVYRAMVGRGLLQHNKWANINNHRSWAQAMTVLDTSSAYLGCLSSQKTAATELAPEHAHLLDVAKDSWLSFNNLGNWGQGGREIKHLHARQQLYIAVNSLTPLMVAADSLIGLVNSQTGETREEYKNRTEESLAKELFGDLNNIPDNSSRKDSKSKRSKGTKSSSAAKPAKGTVHTSY